jgi:hypothetical protein
VLLAFERQAGEWCDVSMLWQTFVQQVRSSTVKAIARKHSRTISSLPSMIRAEALTVHAKLAQVEQYDLELHINLRCGAPSKPGAGEAATNMNKSSGVLECKGCGRKNHAKEPNIV